MPLQTKTSRWIWATSGALAGAAITAALTLAHPVARADAPADSPSATIAVTGHADRWVQPDTAVIDAAVTTMAKDAQTAQKQNGAAMQKVLDALKQAGIPQSQVHTQWYNLQPHYAPGGKNGQPVLDGFQATDDIEVTLKDLSKVGDIVDLLVDNGANQINNVGFQVSNPASIRSELYQAALADAQSQAARIAQSLGLKVSGVKSVDTTSGAPVLPYAKQAAMDASAASVSIVPGPQDVACDVQVVFTATTG
ncbi:MAG: SIMPL domain-containing protein [Alicyclobacillaceae bacterium]|nr:SIMPL domain-containing protein [Alicyclobacillaceae bacterium]